MTMLDDLSNAALPFRFYYPNESARGVERPVLQVGAEWRNGAPDTCGERVNAQTVAMFMHEVGLDYLTGIAEQLAETLQIMKETQPFRETLPEGFVNPVMVLRRYIPKLIPAASETQKLVSNAIDTAGAECPETFARITLEHALEKFISFSQIIMNHTRPAGASKSTAYWHDDAYFLAVHIFEEGKRCGRQVPLSKYDAAGVKLIDRLLGRLARVNHSGPDAIAKELNRRRQNEPFLRI